MDQDEVTDATLSSDAAHFYARYAAAVDREDEAALAALLADGVALTRAGSTVRGRDAFLDVYRGHWSQGIGLCQHVVSNVLAFGTPDRMRATAYFRALFFDSDETRLIVGRYDDDLVREADGSLRVSHKRNEVQRIVSLPSGRVIAQAG